MSARHPIIALTGSSGAGTTTASRTMQKIFVEEGVNVAIVEGDSFHRYTREQMAELAKQGRYGQWNHFSLAANHIDKLEELFCDYGQNGQGRFRHYIHDDDLDLIRGGGAPGTFTPWQSLPRQTDCLFYEGLHGGVSTDDYDIASHVDLLIGVTPIVNLEWIQKIHRDTHDRGYSQEAVVATILNRMEDYVRCIVPQFSHTHINFQRVPTVDTSNPFIMREVPSHDESFVVIRFRNPREVDFPYLINMIANAFASRHDTLVVPGNKLALAIDLIIRPMVLEMIERSRT
ncbi:Phosphoribulokinase [Hahella chejuensis KCTC 2396]|uniref:Phosphoribulokinase n=1 Tax=Hahella chejuensis (strain KCTC 2396) TaxID=349521 RepID=Q2S988_HAHCH|nr:phosphoribulokinase [Hahella chejuensis]ABC32786.1 Phosphoribulokinase [Hahella chejuensis KCTC 2396]